MPNSQKITIAALLIAALVVGVFVFNRTQLSPEARELQESSERIERILEEK